MLARCGHGGRGEPGEVGVGADIGAGEGGVPDLAGALPRVPADRGRREVEGAVGDAGVEVHPAVVVLRLDVLVHGGALRVLAQLGVVVRRAGVGHVAQPARRDAGQEQPGADQPVGLVDGLAEQPLLEARAEHVADRLVEGAGLVLVAQPGGVLGDGVGELVPEHVDGLGEAVEDLAVAVAEDQLGAVPEGVHVVVAVVHRQGDGRARAVVGRAVEDLREEPERAEDAIGRLVDRGVSRRRVTGAADLRAGQGRGAVRGVHGPVGDGGRRAGRRPRGRVGVGHRRAPVAQLGVDGQRRGHPRRGRRVGTRDLLEEVRGDEGAGRLWGVPAES